MHRTPGKPTLTLQPASIEVHRTDTELGFLAEYSFGSIQSVHKFEYSTGLTNGESIIVTVDEDLCNDTDSQALVQAPGTLVQVSVNPSELKDADQLLDAITAEQGHPERTYRAD